MNRRKHTVPGLVVALVAALVALACGPLVPTPGIPTVLQPAPTATLPPTPTPPSTATPPPIGTQLPPSTPVPTQPGLTLPAPTVPPTPACAPLPEGVFLTIWQSDPLRQAALGCPTSNHPRVEPAAWEVQTAYQSFERGAMIWSDHVGWYDKRIIYVLHGDGLFQAADDTYDPASDPAGGGETPPAGLYEPILGFGKVWREEPGVRAALGWATAEEMPGPGRFQLFPGGNMIWLSQRGETTVLLFAGSTYAVVNSPAFE